VAHPRLVILRFVLTPKYEDLDEDHHVPDSLPHHQLRLPVRNCDLPLLNIDRIRDLLRGRLTSTSPQPTGTGPFVIPLTSPLITMGLTCSRPATVEFTSDQ
jgi:hypothetical protein